MKILSLHCEEFCSEYVTRIDGTSTMKKKKLYIKPTSLFGRVTGFKIRLT